MFTEKLIVGFSTRLTTTFLGYLEADSLSIESLTLI